MSLQRGPNKDGVYEFSIDGERWTTDRDELARWKAQERSDQIISDVFHCARCGEDHQGLVFSPFTKPVVDADGTQWGFWTFCPKLGEPILLNSLAAQP